MSDLAAQFSELFAGRRDVYGAVHGECKRVKYRDEWPPLWEGHLHGTSSLGIYPLVQRGSDGVDNASAFRCRWGCSDIDQGYDLLVLARNLYRALEALGIQSWVERTKGKGWHCWVFAQDWVPAEMMRNALLVAHEIAGIKPREVNPKNPDVSGLAEQLGNYVNVPYAKTWADQGRRVVLRHLNDINAPHFTAEDFAKRALAKRTSSDVLEAAAALYVAPPPRRDIGPFDGPSTVSDGLTRRMSGLAWTIFQHGPLDGSDRSGTLAKLAHQLAPDFTPAECLSLVTDADTRHGRKFVDRPDGETQLRKIVENAFA